MQNLHGIGELAALPLRKCRNLVVVASPGLLCAFLAAHTILASVHVLVSVSMLTDLGQLTSDVMALRIPHVIGHFLTRLVPGYHPSTLLPAV